jgi:hypothetical protein
MPFFMLLFAASSSPTSIFSVVTLLLTQNHLDLLQCGIPEVNICEFGRDFVLRVEQWRDGFGIIASHDNPPANAVTAASLASFFGGLSLELSGSSAPFV